MKITFKTDHTFVGAKTGNKHSVKAGVPVNINEEEIVHLDKADYVVGEVKKEDPAKKK